MFGERPFGEFVEGLSGLVSEMEGSQNEPVCRARQQLRELITKLQALQRPLMPNVTGEEETEAWFPCPCCGNLTLPALGVYRICPVCYWEDDPHQSAYPTTRTGANGESLLEAQESFRVFGASGRGWLRYVRPPRASELPPAPGGT